MHILPSGLLALTLILFPLATALAQSNFEPPTAVIVSEDFSPIGPAWQPTLGSWSASNATYANSTRSGTSISVITHYPGLAPDDPGHPQLFAHEFTVRARVRNQGTLDEHEVGVVYAYQDPAHYNAVVISATGNAKVRSVFNGEVSDLPVPGIAAVPRNTWAEIEVHCVLGATFVKINGQGPPNQISRVAAVAGRVGLIANEAVGRFDNVSVSLPFGDQHFLETFSGQPSTVFQPQSGQWSVVNGSYRSGVQQTSISLAPIGTGGHPNNGDTFDYTFRARMFNGYGAAGNLVGIVFNYMDAGAQYTEVVFSPTGVVKLNRFENGVVRTIATAGYDGRRNVAFEVALENHPNHFAVIVDGVRLFEDVLIFDVNPSQFPEGGVGLITHWAPGRFDNVEFDHDFFHPCGIDFGAASLFDVLSGTWTVDGGTLNSTAAGQTDVVDLLCLGNRVGEDAGTNAVYSARLLNQYGASGNLVGLLYNMQRGPTTLFAGDYFEVVFSPTGAVQMNKFIQGVLYPVRTGTHNVPRNTFFDVQVIRSGIFTTIKVNGATVLENVPQGELRGGHVGAVTHWAKGRFDDVSVSEHVVRPPSEL